MPPAKWGARPARGGKNSVDALDAFVRVRMTRAGPSGSTPKTAALHRPAHEEGTLVQVAITERKPTSSPQRKPEV